MVTHSCQAAQKHSAEQRGIWVLAAAATLAEAGEARGRVAQGGVHVAGVEACGVGLASDPGGGMLVRGVCPGLHRRPHHACAATRRRRFTSTAAHHLLLLHLRHVSVDRDCDSRNNRTRKESGDET
ncbi:hypothetical protein NL676_000478 [Syzygium grande]|nr:hypothetical protein NL676_000478 [Syzygium grande]